MELIQDVYVYKCPRHLGQCKCVKYCRETESILIFDDEEIGAIKSEGTEKLNVFQVRLSTK